MSRLLVVIAASFVAFCCLRATSGAPVQVAPEPVTSAAARPRATASDAPADTASSPAPADSAPIDEPDEEPPCPPLDDRWKAAPGPAVRALAARALPIAASLPEEYVGPIDVAPGRVDVVVPPAARAKLRRYKALMADAIEARLGEAVRIANGGSLPACGLEPFMGHSLGERYDSSFVRTVRGALGGRLLGVVFDAPMTGGPDSTLVLFERTASGVYRRAMVVTSQEPTSITDGLLALDFAARTTPDGGYHVITAHGAPWISSLWRGAFLRIWAPGPDAAHPRQLLAEHHSARMGEGVADLRADDTGFMARFLSWGGVGSNDDVRTFVRHFSLVQGGYQRTAPFVLAPGHVTAEWVHSPWSEASRFTAASERARLEPVHRALQANRELRTSIAGADGSREGDRTVWKLLERDEALRYTFVTAIEDGLPVMVDVRAPATTKVPPGVTALP